MNRRARLPLKEPGKIWNEMTVDEREKRTRRLHVKDLWWSSQTKDKTNPFLPVWQTDPGSAALHLAYAGNPVFWDIPTNHKNIAGKQLQPPGALPGHAALRVSGPQAQNPHTPPSFVWLRLISGEGVHVQIGAQPRRQLIPTCSSTGSRLLDIFNIHLPPPAQLRGSMLQMHNSCLTECVVGVWSYAWEFWTSCRAAALILWFFFFFLDISCSLFKSQFSDSLAFFFWRGAGRVLPLLRDASKKFAGRFYNEKKFHWHTSHLPQIRGEPGCSTAITWTRQLTNTQTMVAHNQKNKKEPCRHSSDFCYYNIATQWQIRQSK